MGQGPIRERNGNHSRVVPIDGMGSPWQEESALCGPAEDPLCRKRLH